MFTRIQENLLQDSRECYYFNIPRNFEEDSGECSRGFRGLLKKIPGNIRKDFRECARRFQGMFKKIPGNVQEDSGGMLKKIPGNINFGNLNCDLFCEILFFFIKYCN